MPSAGHEARETRQHRVEEDAVPQEMQVECRAVLDIGWRLRDGDLVRAGRSREYNFVWVFRVRDVQ